MKKICNLLLLILVFTSCNTNEDSIGKSSKIKSTYTSIMKLSNRDDMKLAFSTLSSEEKFQMWDKKYEDLLNGNQYNEKQKEFIVHLKNSINLNVFSKTIESEVFKTYGSENLILDSKKLFDEIDVHYLFYELKNIDKITKSDIAHAIEAAKPGMINVDPLAECGCVVTAECKRLTGVGAWSISWEYGTCNLQQLCSGTTFGCGSLWLSSCVGVCKY